MRFLSYDVLAEPSLIEFMDLVDYQSVDVWRPGIQFESCRFEGGFRYGVACSTHTVDLADSTGFHNCTFQTCGEYAVLADSSAVVIRNTLVQDTRGRGLSLRNVGTAAIITNCIVRGSRTSGLVAENFCSPAVINNVFMDNYYHGVQLVNNCQPLLLNNIIYRNAKYGVFDSLSSFPIMDYNNVYGHWITSGTDTTRLDYHGPNSSAGEHSLSVNPSFVDEAGNLHLSAGSLCVNAGDPRPEFNDAADASRNDMGAYGGPAGGAVGASPLRRTAQPLASK